MADTRAFVDTRSRFSRHRDQSGIGSSLFSRQTDGEIQSGHDDPHGREKPNAWDGLESGKRDGPRLFRGSFSRVERLCVLCWQQGKEFGIDFRKLRGQSLVQIFHALADLGNDGWTVLKRMELVAELTAHEQERIDASVRRCSSSS